MNVGNSLISDNHEILFNKNTQIELNENTIKVEGSYVPEFVDIVGGSIEMLDETIIPPPEPTYLKANSFSISRTEVTFKQFDAFCVATSRKNLMIVNGEEAIGRLSILLMLMLLHTATG